MARARFPRLLLKLRTLFHGEQVDSELDEEIRYHLERKTELLIAQGMRPPDARYTALRAFGGIEVNKESCRDARGPVADRRAAAAAAVRPRTRRDPPDTRRGSAVP